ncbi:MAG: DUF502 domain-containing protein [Verrucomicrobiales bacterium]
MNENPQPAPHVPPFPSESAPEEHEHEKGFWRRIRNKFLAGLAFVVPLIATFWVLTVVYKVLNKVSTPILWGICWVLNKTLGGYHAEGAGGQEVLREFEPSYFNIHLFDFGNPEGVSLNVVGVLILILLLVALGFMATHVIGRRVVHAMDALLMRVPVVSFIYRALKQVIDAFKSYSDTQNFQGVAFVEYPSPGCWLVGFITGRYQDPDLGGAMTAVFLPTSPNPMTGFVVMVESARIRESSMSLEDATKMIFSAGLVSPHSAAKVALAPKPPPRASDP